MFNQKYTANAGHASAGTTKSSFSEIRPVAWALFLHVTATEAECLSDWSIEHSERRGTSASVRKGPVARWSRGMILA